MGTTHACVEVLRGGVVESRHRISAALVDEAGRLIAHTGDPGLVTYFRSAAKPFQAIPLLADGAADEFGLGAEEIAISCASHSGEPSHVEVVQSLLRRIGCVESDLECGPHPPFHQEAAEALRREGRSPTRLHNNCSGKHAAMLACAKYSGVPMTGYSRANHPVQVRIGREIRAWTGVSDRMEAAIDGCGVVTYALPLDAMALAFARLAARGRRDPDGVAGRVVAAMTGHPYLVGGTGRLCTDLMESAGGAFLAKGGAEGLLCVADLDRGRGMALKVEDGGRRAVAPAALEFLARAEVLGDDVLAALASHRTGAVTNSRDEMVGEIRAVLRVERSE